jgi:hypothetical protein
MGVWQRHGAGTRPGLQAGAASLRRVFARLAGMSNVFHGGTMPDRFARRICETDAVRQMAFAGAAFSWASIKGAKT